MTQSLNSAFIPGPTYAEMLDPATLPAALRNKAVAAARGDELDPANLFNITWRGPDQGIRHVLLPKELTGVKANIVVMVGHFFPSGSHKVDVKMTLTAPGCGMGPMLAQDVQNRVLALEGVDDVAVELVWDPPWNQSMMTEAAKLQLGLL